MCALTLDRDTSDHLPGVLGPEYVVVVVFRIIHVPKLESLEICRVLPVKHMLKSGKSQQTDPLLLL